MSSLVPELLAEAIPLAIYGVGAAALTVLGALAEYNSLQHLETGDAALALWFAAIGGIMLYAGLYGLGYRKLLARAV